MANACFAALFLQLATSASAQSGRLKSPARLAQFLRLQSLGSVQFTYKIAHQIALGFPMNSEVDSRGYLAPLLAPTLHVALVPLWSVFSGHAETALVAMAWQTIAWFFLEAVCLATMSPLLWLFRRQILWRPLNRNVSGGIAFLFAVAASFLLFRSPLVSWLSAFVASAFAFGALQTRKGK